MTFSLIISMSLFALAASLSPGPVNLVSLSGSARHGMRAGLVFITGATLGFIVLFLLIGFGLHYLIDELNWITQILQWLGIAFLLYLSHQLFIDDGELSSDEHKSAPTFMTGAMMQWLNPKAGWHPCQVFQLTSLKRIRRKCWYLRVCIYRFAGCHLACGFG